MHSNCLSLLIIVSLGLMIRSSFAWKPEEVSNLLKLMQEYGNVELENKNNKLIAAGYPPLVKQYLVATVLSENEIKDSRNWGQIPEAIQTNNDRIKVIFNDKNYKHFPYKTKKPLHGEVLMLMDHQDIPLMTKKLRNKNTFPFVVLYSHYIPCSDVKGVEYSCAEELANDAICNHGEYKMLVGYKDIFHGTAKDKSVKFMQMGGIELFQFEQNTLISVKSDNELQPGNEAKIFQDLFYRCLDLTPMSEECCTVEKSVPNYQLTKQSILSLYVNTVVYFCTTVDLKEIKGKFTKLSRWALAKCIGDYAESHTGNDCPYCPAISTKFTIKVCGLLASTFGTEVGRPENPNEPFSPKWKEGGPVAWNTLYYGYNVNAAVNRPAIFCLKQPLSIQSLCTKLTNQANNIDHKTMDRVRLLKEEYKKNKNRLKVKTSENIEGSVDENIEGSVDEQKKTEKSKKCRGCCICW